MDSIDYGPEDRLVAVDVARGVSRLFLRHDLLSIAEVPLGNGRRADLFALSPKGLVTIVEIKVSKADLLGDSKWPDYLDYCDRYFWAVPQGFDLGLMERPSLMPERTGLIVADRYDAAILREAQSEPEQLKGAPHTMPLRRLDDVQLRELETRRIKEALRATGGVRKRAAELIGMPLRTLVLRLKQYGLGQDEG